MIRWLDYNDCWLAAEWGHPSDNLGGILAVSDWLSRTNKASGKEGIKMSEVLTGMIQAHEVIPWFERRWHSRFKGVLLWKTVSIELALIMSFSLKLPLQPWFLDFSVSPSPRRTTPFHKLGLMVNLFERIDMSLIQGPESLGLQVMLVRELSIWHWWSRREKWDCPVSWLLKDGDSMMYFLKVKNSNFKDHMEAISWRIFCSRFLSPLSLVLFWNY